MALGAHKVFASPFDIVHPQAFNPHIGAILSACQLTNFAGSQLAGFPSPFSPSQPKVFWSTPLTVCLALAAIRPSSSQARCFSLQWFRKA